MRSALFKLRAPNLSPKFKLWVTSSWYKPAAGQRAFRAMPMSSEFDTYRCTYKNARSCLDDKTMTSPHL
ncbi:unnamed protein product [Dovyalis caffra]|uniref:Uncharacterized protein n=1 Tax=Dovyalis caffra TaxID=77055 RepID=A0AAV1SIQ7_9ROSI|nr:unnamed protein product [Dovyalis caffra]